LLGAKLGMRMSPMTVTVIDHLSSLAREWSTTLTRPRWISSTMRSFLQYLIFGSCMHLLLGMKHNKLVYSAVARRLGNVPWVLFDDSAWVLPSAVVLELDEDLAEQARAPPDYLRPIEVLLRIAGSRSSAADSQPMVRIATPNPSEPSQLHSRIVFSMDDASFADVVFVVDDQYIYAHRLVLALTNDTLRTMFLSGLEGPSALIDVPSHQATKRSLPSIVMPDWCDHATAKCFVRYLYTGEVTMPDGSPIGEATPSNDTVAHVCMLLRVADVYFAEHLREWCEHYLATSGIITILNVCDLLTHAHGCNARQLQAVCRHHILSNLTAVKSTPQWQELSADLKAFALATLTSNQ